MRRLFLVFLSTIGFGFAQDVPTPAPTPETLQEIFLATIRGDTPAVAAQIQNHADINARSTIKLPPEAEVQFPPKVWRRLRNEIGLTPLMLAAGRGDTSTVKILLQAGAPKWTTSPKWKNTAPNLACIAKAQETVQALIGEAGYEKFKIKISLSKQKVTLFEEDTPILESPISSGRKNHPTPEGTYVITEKYGPVKRSTLYPANMPYFMRLDYLEFGLHGGELPGYPASHGCVRMPVAKAKELNRKIPLGTLVEISQ